jgi:hypothetical protein
MPQACIDRRLLLGLILAAHDNDELGFTALLNDVPRSQLRTVVRTLTEMVVGVQVVNEDEPGAARESLACEALALAAR